jgi:hypothetical protein
MFAMVRPCAQSASSLSARRWSELVIGTLAELEPAGLGIEPTDSVLAGPVDALI